MSSETLRAPVRGRTRPGEGAPDAPVGRWLDRLASSVWRTLTSVRFAVLQIIVIVVCGLIGTMLRQIGSFSLANPASYARDLAQIHERMDPLTILGLNIGPGMVDVFDRLGFFRIFSAPWFTVLVTLLVVSIVVCTADRTPRLWRGVREVRPVQPESFFDLRLPERARMVSDAMPADELARALRRRRFKVRTVHPAEGPGAGADAPPVHVYGDRNQYFRMATLLTHLGLILFLAGGAVTGALGYETVVFVGEGQTAPIQAVGTPGNLLVKNIDFQAPQRADGSFEDFWTDLAVYRDGQEIARKTIRVNDPLSIAGFVFHQNTFGPAVDLEIRDAGGGLVWTGPLILAGELLGLPQGFMTIPGSEIGLVTLLDRDASGASALVLSGVVAGREQPVFVGAIPLGGQTNPAATAGYSIAWKSAGAWTGMVVKNDPGQGIIWLAFLSLISGLVLTFYFPRRRVWARLRDGEWRFAMLADRYVDAAREFDVLLEDLAVRTGTRPERRPPG